MTDPTALTARHIAILSVLGAFFWFVAAILVRTIAPLGALEGGWRVVTYALVVPGTVPVLLLGRALAGLPRAHTGSVATIMSASALLLDGSAFAWFPGLYGADNSHHLGGAASILWGAGVALILGLVMSRGPQE
jgi:hypothetical protein